LSGETVTVIWLEDVTVTIVDPEIAGLDRDVEVIEIVAGVGGLIGAVYSPVEVIDPQAMPEQPLPETDQITTPLAEPLATNCNCAPGLSWGKAGVTLSCEEAATRVTMADAERLGAAMALAVIVTLDELGKFVGAV
jgi:hypothetical protein